MRTIRTAVVGATLAALILGACGSGAGSPSPSPEATVAGATLASTLVMGGPPECPQRPFCLVGLRETYGLEFREFKPLDTGGPITVEALDNGEIDVALLFTSDPSIEARDFVLLEDDRQLQRADNLVPVISAQIVDDHPAVAELLNGVSALLTQEELVELNRRVRVDREDPPDVAGSWLEEKGLLANADTTIGAGTTAITVGKTNFDEQDILSELYAQILEANGFTLTRQEASGTREVVFPALEGGQINLLPEYAATALEYVNSGADEANADADETTGLLRQRLEPLGLTALDPAPATDQNAIVVTRALSNQHGLTKVSDLAKPAP